MRSLRAKLAIGLGGVLAILVIVGVLSMIVFAQYNHALEKMFRDNYDSVLYCNQMRDALDELNSQAQRLVWHETRSAFDGDPAGQFEKFQQNIDSELNNCNLPGELEAAQKVAVIWKLYKDNYRLLGTAGSDDHQLFRDQLLPQYQQLKRTAQYIADINSSNMVSVDGQVRTTLARVQRALLILVAAGTALGVALVATVGATILKPLRALTSSARQIEKGNLEMIIPVGSKDELGQLTEAFNSMASRLREFRRLDSDRLARTQQTTQLAIDSLPDAVIVVSPNREVEISNHAARSLFNICSGASVDQLKLTWLSKCISDVLASGVSQDSQGYESAIQVFDRGRERFFLPKAVPIKAGEAVIGVTLILMDVTRLRHADELKSGLVSTVSHELRTPLTGLRMAIGLLQDVRLSSLDTRQEKLVQTAYEESERLFEIIENLLNLSRIESGRAQLDFQRVTARQLIEPTIEQFAERFAAKRVAIKLEFADNLPEILVDQTYIGHAVSNLLSNALKFTPSGGSVIIRAERESNRLVVRVIDSGIGIPPQLRAQVFQKFFRASASGPAGIGLGLSIAKEILEVHNGVISYRPGDEGGSCFSISLEAAGANAAVCVV